MFDWISTDKSAELIPMLNVLVTGNGVVVDSFTGEKKKQEMSEGDWFTETSVEGYRSVRTGVLVCIAHKNIRIPPPYWNKLTVGHVDGDVNNLDAENLVIKFPSEGIRYRSFPVEYFYIPCYTRYAISREGVVLDTFTDMVVATVLPKNNTRYPVVNLYPDCREGSRAVPLHRLMAIVFHPYPTNVDSLDVNHIDGNKCNYSPDNLEWCTRRRNTVHAFENNLRVDNTPVKVKNVLTGDVTDFYSIAECARMMEKHPWTINYRLGRPGKVFDGMYLFKVGSDDSDWVILRDRERRDVPILARDIITGNVTRYPSKKAAARTLNINISSIATHLSSREPPPLKGHDFREDGPKVQWPNWSDSIIALVKSGNNIKGIPVRLTDTTTGEITDFASAAAVGKFLGVSRAYACRTAITTGTIGKYKLQQLSLH